MNNYYKNLNVIYVEVNTTTLRYFELTLKNIFNNVFSFSDSKKAIDFYKNNHDGIDVIICDIQLEKGFLGVDFLRIVREIDNKVPFILTTGVLDSQELIESIRLKANDILIKPIKADVLLASLESVCKNKYYEESFIQSSQTFDDIVSVVNEVALINKTDINENITEVNKAFCEVTGYSEDELIGKNLSLIRKEDNSISQRIIQTVKNGEIWEGKVKNINKNKEDFYSYITVIPIFDKNKNEIKELTWIRFLATEYEKEQQSFRKKVTENLNKNRRINNEARVRIDELQAQLFHYKNLDAIYESEKQRNMKFQNQYKYIEEETNKSSKKLDDIQKIAKEKLRQLVVDQKKIELRKNEVSKLLNSVVEELNLKNKTAEELLSELKEQTKIIEELLLEIKIREREIGID